MLSRLKNSTLMSSYSATFEKKRPTSICFKFLAGILPHNPKEVSVGPSNLPLRSLNNPIDKLAAAFDGRKIESGTKGELRSEKLESLIAPWPLNYCLWVSTTTDSLDCLHY